MKEKFSMEKRRQKLIKKKKLKAINPHKSKMLKAQGLSK